MSRVYNFSAGPSMLPELVLQRAASEMLDYGGSGQSVMEMSHRSSAFQSIIDRCEALLRELMEIPEDYAVLFLQGGASTQFAMVPLNLAVHSGKADYILTGQWAKKAASEGKLLLGEENVHIAGSSAEGNFSYIPEEQSLSFSPDADYVHICLNNTIYGTLYPYIPDTGNVPLVADISSMILSQPLPVSRFGLLYAGAQKNMGPAGLTVVIGKKSLLEDARPNTPTMLRYKTHLDAGSMYNTPPCYAIYICMLVLEWLKNDIGGLKEMEKLNREKAKLLYDFLDESTLFKGTVEKGSRSLMNVPFVTGDKDLDSQFVKEAEKAGLVNLKGHRTVGGMRASIYNAMPLTGVKALIDFMKDFEAKNQ